MKTVSIHSQKIVTDEILSLAHQRVALVKEITDARERGDMAKVSELRAKLLELK